MHAFLACLIWRVLSVINAGGTPLPNCLTAATGSIFNADLHLKSKKLFLILA